MRPPWRFRRQGGRAYVWLAAHKDRGPAVCSGIAAKYARVDRVVLDYVRGAMSAPDVLQWIERETLRRATELARDTSSEGRRARANELEREIARLVEAIATSGYHLHSLTAYASPRPNETP